VQGIKETGDDKQHRNAEPENAIGKKILGEGGQCHGFPWYGPWLHIPFMQVVAVYKDKKEHGQKRPEFEFQAVKIRNGLRLVEHFQFTVFPFQI
jgi:hypothetical protein